LFVSQTFLILIGINGARVTRTFIQLPSHTHQRLLAVSADIAAKYDAPTATAEKHLANGGASDDNKFRKYKVRDIRKRWCIYCQAAANKDH
jgi:hypothetical protein